MAHVTSGRQGFQPVTSKRQQRRAAKGVGSDEVPEPVSASTTEAAVVEAGQNTMPSSSVDTAISPTSDVTPSRNVEPVEPPTNVNPIETEVVDQPKHDAECPA